MKQIGLAVLNYENAKNVLPPMYTRNSDPDLGTDAQSNIMAHILPYFEQTAIAAQYNLDADYTGRSDKASQNAALIATVIPILICPSTPPPSDMTTAPCDYAIASDFTIGANQAMKTLIRADLITDRGAINVINPDDRPEGHWFSMLGTVYDSKGTSTQSDDEFQWVKLKQVTDGTSNTMMFFEDAGRPDDWENGQLIAAVGHTSNPNGVTGTGWADVQSFFSVHNECGGGQMMNCHNNNEIYSFHRGGCNFVFGDGSVHFIAENINPETFVSLFTRNAEDIVKGDF
jgi:prepilin-type processing-associated H-X9-DG protein